MADLKHLGHMFPDVLKGDVFKFSFALRTSESVYFQIHPFTIGASAGQSPVGHQMGFDFIKVEFLVNPDKSLRHKQYYNKKSTESSIFILLSSVPRKDPAGLSQWMISVDSNSFIPLKLTFGKWALAYF